MEHTAKLLGRGRVSGEIIAGLVFKHMSYLDLWYLCLDGKIVIKYLLFFLSLTVLFLFLTVKVLESRKWR